jgi:hypothetical protein
MGVIVAARVASGRNSTSERPKHRGNNIEINSSAGHYLYHGLRQESRKTMEEQTLFRSKVAKRPNCHVKALGGTAVVKET